MVKVINFERKTNNHDSQLNKCKIRFFVIEGNVLASIWQNNSRLFPFYVPAYKYRRYTIIILQTPQYDRVQFIFQFQNWRFIFSLEELVL
mgnify:CR=1 FL=1